MTKGQYRRWVVRVIELCICMVVLSGGCVVAALIMSAILRALGVG